MKSELLQLLICVECDGAYVYMAPQQELVCQQCGRRISLEQGKPIFSPVPADIQPANKRARGADVDTPWRTANRQFLTTQAEKLPVKANILDVGAGQGDFAELFSNQNYFAVDIYPYPAVDLVCDLTKLRPFRPGSLDVIILANVIEHVPDVRALLMALAQLLRSGGEIWITVPFLIKIHQAPYDFARYTEYLLKQLGEEAGCEVVQLNGYYDSVFLIGESQQYFRYWVLPTLKRTQRYLAVVYLRLVNLLTRMLLQPMVGKGKLRPVAETRNPAPVGYMVVYRKTG